MLMDKGDEILPGRSIDDFLCHEGDKPLEEDTRRIYRNALLELRDFLKRNGAPTSQLLVRWRQELGEKGYQERSVNLHITAANGYFRWCGRPELVMRHCRTVTPAQSPELTRPEYLRLLCTARTQGRHRLYLIVKLFAATDLPLQCLDQVTAELVQSSGGKLNCRGSQMDFRLPEHLQKELLDYMAENEISQGPVFVTRNGKPLDRSNLFREMRELCRAAGVPEEKGNLRALRNLYHTPQNEISAQMEQLLRQAYNQLLQAEQATGGWKEGQEIRAG